MQLQHWSSESFEDVYRRNRVKMLSSQPCLESHCLWISANEHRWILKVLKYNTSLRLKLTSISLYDLSGQDKISISHRWQHARPVNDCEALAIASEKMNGIWASCWSVKSWLLRKQNFSVMTHQAEFEFEIICERLPP